MYIESGSSAYTQKSGRTSKNKFMSCEKYTKSRFCVATYLVFYFVFLYELVNASKFRMGAAAAKSHGWLRFMIFNTLFIQSNKIPRISLLLSSL